MAGYNGKYTPDEINSDRRKAVEFYYDVLETSVCKGWNHDESFPGEEKTADGVKTRKMPAYKKGEFTPYLYNNRSTPDQVFNQWFPIKNPNVYNVIIPTGTVSSILVWDIDGEAKERLESIQLRMSLNLRLAFKNTMMVKTGGGGYQFYFRVEPMELLSKLRSKAIWDAGKGSEARCKAQGGFVVGISSRHPHGGSYVWDGMMPEILTEKEIDEFVRLMGDKEKAAKAGISFLYESPPSEYSDFNWDEIGNGKTSTTATDDSSSNTKPTEVRNQEGLTIAQARLASTFKEYYGEGSRQNLWVGISGLFRRNLIPEQDAINACINCCKQFRLLDEEIDKRVYLIRRTYEDKKPVEVGSWGWLEDLLKSRNTDMNEEEREKKILEKKRQMLAVLFEFKLEITKRDNPWALINQNPETYFIMRRADNTVDVIENGGLVPVRRVQVLKVERAKVNVGGNIDNLGRGDILDLKFDEIMIDAVPATPINIVIDPLFGGTKYGTVWEHVNQNTNAIEKTDFSEENGIGSSSSSSSNKAQLFLRTKEDLEKQLKTKATWVRKLQRLPEVLGSTIDAYKNKGDGDHGFVKYSLEIGPSGFFWYDGKILENKLNLGIPDKFEWNLENPEFAKLIHETAKIAVEAIIEMQSRFFNGARGRDKLRFAHYLKWHIVAPFDYIRKQLKLTERYGWVPRSDMSGDGGTGKTTYGRLGCLMYGLDKDAYIIPKRSIRSEARFIEMLGETTMPLTFEEPDFLTHTDKASIEDYISTLKDSVSKMMSFRLMPDHTRILEHYLAPILLAHNSAPIMEEGMSRRFIVDGFEKVDVKDNKNNPALVQQMNEFNAYALDKAEETKAIGRFVSMYVRTHPEVLENEWDVVGWKVLEEMWKYAKEAGATATIAAVSAPFLSLLSSYPPLWLKHTLLDIEAVDVGLIAASEGNDRVRNHYKEQVLAAFQTYVNDEFARQGRLFENDESMQAVYARFDQRLQWLAKNSRLPGVYYRPSSNEIFFFSSLKGVLVKKYHVEPRAFPSLDGFASNCGFECRQRKINGENKRAAFIDCQELINQIVVDEIEEEEEGAAAGGEKEATPVTSASPSSS